MRRGTSTVILLEATQALYEAIVGLLLGRLNEAVCQSRVWSAVLFKKLSHATDALIEHHLANYQSSTPKRVDNRSSLSVRCRASAEPWTAMMAVGRRKGELMTGTAAL